MIFTMRKFLNIALVYVVAVSGSYPDDKSDGYSIPG